MKTNWKKHEAVIVSGDKKAFSGWLDAGVECYKKGVSVSAYVKASPSTKVTASSQEKYIGAFVRALKKYKGNVNAMLADYDKVYSYREIVSFIAFAPAGQRAKNAKKDSAELVARTITYSGVVKDLRDAGFTTIEINAIAKALRLKK